MRTLSAEQYNAMAKKSNASKYRNKKCEEDGYTFDSQMEHRRYQELKHMVAAGEITGLEVHPRFPLNYNEHKITTYVADFLYFDRQGFKLTVEDVKTQATKTPAYNIKKKLVKAAYNIDIIEVKA